LGIAKEQAPFIGEDTFVAHLLKMLSLDKIQVRVVFLSAINTSGKNRHSVSIEARTAILDSIAEYQKTDNSILRHGS
jgi:lyso-ornithine lipid O-acyltransferase